MRRSNPRTWLFGFAGIMVVALLPLPLALQAAVSLGLTLAIAAVGLDIFMGYTGQLSFGHFGFVASGAYLAAIAQGQWGWNVWATLPLSLIGTAILALIIGIPMVRLPELGSALVSFFFAFIMIVLIGGNLLVSITRGESGLASAPATLGDLDLNQGTPLCVFALASLAIVTFLALRYVNSRSGKMLHVIKHNSTVATSLGSPVRRAKLTSFIVSAVCCGFAGFIFGQSLGILSPDSFSPFQSIYLAAMVVVGGLGSLYGPIIGALFFTIVTELSFGAGSISGIVFAVILLIALILLPGGIRGSLGKAIARFVKPRRGPARDATSTIELPPEVVARIVVRDRETAHALRGSAEATSGAPADRGDDALRITDLAVHFGGVAALDDVQLIARAGTVHGLVGPNGAGKTTLLNCICRLQRYTGDVQLAGRSLRGVAPHSLRSLGIARSFQHPALALDLTAHENVEMGMFAISAGPAFRRHLRFRQEENLAVDEVLELARVPARRWGVPAGELSMAELKTLDVARALVGKPRVLLMDEPTAGLESEEMGAMSEIITAARDRGTTVLVISHHVGFLQTLADEVTVLNFGRSIATGSFDSVFRREDVLDAFMGVSL